MTSFCVFVSSVFHLHMCKKPMHCSVVPSIRFILVGPVLPSMFNWEALSYPSPPGRPLQSLLSPGYLQFSLRDLRNGEACSYRGLRTGSHGRGTHSGLHPGFWCWGISPASCLLLLHWGNFPVEVRAVWSSVISKIFSDHLLAPVWKHSRLLINFEIVMVVTKDRSDIANYTLCRAETTQMENRAAELDKGTNIQVMCTVAGTFYIPNWCNRLTLICHVCNLCFIWAEREL